jgi:hypothetical protein
MMITVNCGENIVSVPAGECWKYFAHYAETYLKSLLEVCKSFVVTLPVRFFKKHMGKWIRNHYIATQQSIHRLHRSVSLWLTLAA